jgi:hypothetical protein
MTIATHRLRNQRLIGPLFDTPQAVMRWLGAVQAQDYHSAKWALALRIRDADAAALDGAFNKGEFLRIHVMRPTWHFVAPEDIRWLLALTGPRVHAANTYYYRKLELDEDTFRRSHTILAETLEGSHFLTRPELARALEAGGIVASGQRLAYLMMHAELDVLVCSGPLRGKQHTYALLDERVPPAPSLARDEALTELTRRYFISHGPATVHDFAWWSGLTVSDVRTGLDLIGSEVEQMALDGKTYWTGAPVRTTEAVEPVVHLLPNYDEHVVAYKDHGPSLDPAARDALRSRTDGPLDAHLVTRAGLVVGGWRRTLEKGVVVVKADLLVVLRHKEQAALEQAAEGYGRFIRLPVVLRGV